MQSSSNFNRRSSKDLPNGKHKEDKNEEVKHQPMEIDSANISCNNLLQFYNIL